LIRHFYESVMHHTAYISIGSNIGDGLANCRSGAAWLAGSGNVTVFSHSRYYRTEPVGYPDQNWFVNAVFGIGTPLDPFELLELLQAAQRIHGREKTAIRFGPRVLDLDILFYDDMIVEEPGLVIPHPRIGERRFVLEPLCDIAPQWMHPALGVSAVELLGGLPAGGPACIPLDAQPKFQETMT